ncbi:MAG: dipicolinate synthase subunit [Epulopiscium sp.]|jgi:dipicolinate synthase subunit B|uniref:Dipicolinate synthase subunit B n=1 Tax=Defluviitalea raffinosedens TaxID=1450156 RepID=A0A7C8HGB8_9FIRM|nr:dipicolinate synthase subunit B [Defluviitalea raffinosedens]MBZ4668565.1 dipicolinic acid synthetase, subunit [Defluviitaleaceae bacterium]MDK2787203.1 dipicolinate synthase subunit [Candidatus Epulonipiscium sp.]KAE9637090.1 dipicolinate synthase subunit B [Defluviitalea raffinosedens]MBM7685151.1 dipicolinate synthase subunit B [Defluviitalea raffinosedens]HHW66890.1 dipicolinate synthase subunit B [Candidatus Epulonipiscium sp.]
MSSLKGVRVGFALCGSYCTYDTVLPELQKLIDEGAEIFPIMSNNAYTTDTRFGKAQEHIDKIEKMTGKKIIKSIVEAEPLGPKNIIDLLVIAPCTGNTVAKLANAITDTAVLMAAKSLLRNKKPVVIALATNDGLGMNMKNIGLLMNTKNIYFVPMGQDNYEKKPNSIMSDMTLILKTVQKALKGEQLQPVIIELSK